jgi:hypothetical protein
MGVGEMSRATCSHSTSRRKLFLAFYVLFAFSFSGKSGVFGHVTHDLECAGSVAYMANSSMSIWLGASEGA